jgi:hypothetical protein
LPRKRRDAALARRLERDKPTELQVQAMGLAIAGVPEREICRRLRLPSSEARGLLQQLADLIAPQPRSHFDAMRVAFSFETGQYYDVDDLRKP